MKLLADGFENMHAKLITFKQLRNNVRRRLYQEDNNSFPYGYWGTSLPDLAKAMFYNPDINLSSYNTCFSCD